MTSEDLPDEELEALKDRVKKLENPDNEYVSISSVVEKTIFCFGLIRVIVLFIYQQSLLMPKKMVNHKSSGSSKKLKEYVIIIEYDTLWEGGRIFPVYDSYPVSWLVETDHRLARPHQK